MWHLSLCLYFTLMLAEALALGLNELSPARVKGLIQVIEEDLSESILMDLIISNHHTLGRGTAPDVILKLLELAF